MSVKALVISRADLINMSVKVNDDVQAIQVTEWYIEHGFVGTTMILFIKATGAVYPVDINPTFLGISFWRRPINFTYEEFINTLIVVI